MIINADNHATEMLKVLHYDRTVGVFIWKEHRGKAALGSFAGHKDNEGYVKIIYKSRSVRAHRLAWFAVHGRFPYDEIDHINGVRDDNRINNLRECVSFQNNQNKPIISSNTSGHPGVHLAKGIWRVRIMIKGERHSLGVYSDFETACKIYNEKKAELHKFNPTVRGL